MQSLTRQPKNSWTYRTGNEPNKIHFLLSKMSIKVRQEQFNLFLKFLNPNKNDQIADVGASSVEELPDTNFFEKIYPYPENITAISIDDRNEFVKRYPGVRFQQISPGKRLPFKDKSFEIVVSWATLEHVGGKEQQRFFLSELFRIGKKVFITTPYRGCFYEPHTNLLFVHWLPRPCFHLICRLTGKRFWVSENNLRCLWKKEAIELLPEKEKVTVMTYKMFNYLPSHLVIYKT